MTSFLVLFDEVLYLATSVDHGPVVTTAECFADFLQRVLGEISAKVHCDLSRYGDVIGAAAAEHIGMTQLEIISDLLLNGVDGELLLGGFHQYVAEKHLAGADLKRIAGKRRVAADLDQGAFEAANVLNDVLSDEIDDFVRYFEIMLLRFFAEDGDARFEIRRLYIGYQSPLESGYESIFEFGDFVCGAVAREKDLFLLLEEFVEGVEEFFLNSFLAAQKLDIVEEKHIDFAVALAKFGQGVFLNSADEFVGEFL